MDMVDIKKKLGVRISQLRMKAGMTQAKLAEGADLSVDVFPIASALKDWSPLTDLNRQPADYKSPPALFCLLTISITYQNH